MLLDFKSFECYNYMDSKSKTNYTNGFYLRNEIEMEDFNSCEYGAEQKAEGRYALLKLLMLLLYAGLCGGYFVILYSIRLIPLFAITPIWLWIVCHFTWRYTKPDYRYVIESGRFTFYVAYGKKTKKRITEFKISSAEAIARRDILSEKIAEYAPRHIYSAVPSVHATDVYAALYTDEHGDKCVIYFVATAQALKLLRLHNSRTVVTPTAI